jgi:hypothetical protein
VRWVRGYEPECALCKWSNRSRFKMTNIKFERLGYYHPFDMDQAQSTAARSLWRRAAQLRRRGGSLPSGLQRSPALRAPERAMRRIADER